MPGTRTVRAKENEDSIDEMMQGYPEEQQVIPDPRTDIHDPIVPSNILDNSMSVTLVNLRYPNEVVFLPQSIVTENGVKNNQFSPQHYKTFTDGVLVCSEKESEAVLAQCPYVRREPVEGEVMVYQPSGFATRNAQTYADHVTRYNEDFVG